MKPTFAVCALVGAGLWACSQSPKAVYTRSSGSVALSSDGATVYVVDTDNDAVVWADAATGARLGATAVGNSPARILVAPDGRAYVSNFADRTVSVLIPSSQRGLSELARIPVDVEPVGLGLSSDGHQLFVVCATGPNDPTTGTITAFDTKTFSLIWSANAGNEPRGLAVVGSTGYVTNLKQGTVTMVDLQGHSTLGVINLNNDDDPNSVTNPRAVTAGAVTEATPSPDGARIYMTQVWQAAGPVGTRGGSAYGASPSSNGSMGSIVSAGIGTIDTATNTRQVDSFIARTSPNAGAKGVPNYPRSMLSLLDRGTAVQGPSAAVVDPTGQWLMVANRLSDNVVVVPTSREHGDPDPKAVQVGAGPDGLAVSSDGATLYVYSQLDHTLSLVSPSTGAGTPFVVSASVLAADPPTLTAGELLGRRMFFSATDRRMTSPAVGIACASCHLEGREDGHVWQLADGKRQTPSLAGRSLGMTAPFHWAGLFPTLDGFFTETIVGRMGGAGSGGDGHGSLGLNPVDSANLEAFVTSIPAADNPFKSRPDLAASQARGQAAFAKAGCVQCHQGTVLTDNQMHDVGTLHDDDLQELIVEPDGIGGDPITYPPLSSVNTPSLLGLGRTAPYLHDGSIASVAARIAASAAPGPGGQFLHGDTSVLSPQELGDLEGYLLSL